MRAITKNVVMLSSLLALADCQLGGNANVPTPPPATIAASAPTSAPPATAVASTATTVPTTLPTSIASAPIANIAPVDATVPAGFKPGSAGAFASFKLPNVQTSASIQAPPIAADLGNVDQALLLSPEQRARIAQNGFAVSPGDAKEFYELYERTRYDNVPVFVSSDSILHVYHLLFDKMLRTSETNAFIPMLTRLDWQLLNSSAEQYKELAGTPWAEAARRNAAYFAVAVKLLNPDWSVPEGLRDLTDPDLAQIAAHSAIGPSAIFPAYPNGEDWSQYLPRGHYTKSDALKRYFTAMIWHGRMTFRASDTTETQQAALLTLALKQAKVGDEPALALWSGIYEPTVFFVGRSDDLTPTEYDGALQAAYGALEAPTGLVDDAKFARFQAEIAKLRAPEILGMVVAENTNVAAETKGLRFMGQRFVPDAFVFQQLVADKVPGRALPKALDFFAAVGSDRALAHLTTAGDSAQPNYAPNMQKLRDTFAGYDEQVWTQNLYWSWIHSLRPLLAPVGDGYPQFMRSDAWLDKQLNTALGSWTELKHDTILYAKQSYAEGAGGGPPPPVPPKGYVEPVPALYARISALGQMTIDGLDSRGLLADQDKSTLSQLVDLANQLQAMSEKELRGEALTADEYTAIQFYGRTIEGLTIFAGDMNPDTGESDTTDQAALAADVATDPGGQVLEEAIGRIFEIYAVVPIDGKLVLAKGGVFSHYEFAQPLSDRLTDEAWRAQLDAGKAPPLGPETASFLVEQKAGQDLADTIHQFNLALVNASWYADAQGVSRFLADPELSDTSAYINQLKASNQFVSMERLGLQYLSFDFQDAQHATVTTHEQWRDELFNGTPEELGGTPSSAGKRGPYETTVTYTMQQGPDGQWQISKIITRPAPPAWK